RREYWSMPSSNQDAEIPVPVPSSRICAAGFEDARARNSVPVSLSDPILKPIFLVSASINSRTAGGVMYTASFIFTIVVNHPRADLLAVGVGSGTGSLTSLDTHQTSRLPS